MWISSAQVCFIVADKTSLEIFIEEQTDSNAPDVSNSFTHVSPAYVFQLTSCPLPA